MTIYTASDDPMNANARPVEATPASLHRALPAWVYNHPEMSRLESERILRPSWQLVCHLSSLEKPGDTTLAVPTPAAIETTPRTERESR